jgi:hypothetical protein
MIARWIANNTFRVTDNEGIETIVSHNPFDLDSVPSCASCKEVTLALCDHEKAARDWYSN